MNQSSDSKHLLKGDLARGTASMKEESLSSNQRAGLKLFALYCVAYGTFIGVNVVSPQFMPVPILAGVNLAIIFGLGLILLAFVLSLVYLGIAKSGRDVGDQE
jgi:uncharacterized membrane protein (DUF485 family)